jgi:hypothetical protein
MREEVEYQGLEARLDDNLASLATLHGDRHELRFALGRLPTFRCNRSIIAA